MLKLLYVVNDRYFVGFFPVTPVGDSHGSLVPKEEVKDEPREFQPTLLQGRGGGGGGCTPQTYGPILTEAVLKSELKTEAVKEEKVDNSG